MFLKFWAYIHGREIWVDHDKFEEKRVKKVKASLKWRKNNREKSRKLMRKWQNANREKCREASKSWYRNNLEYARERGTKGRHIRYAKEKDAELNYDKGVMNRIQAIYDQRKRVSECLMIEMHVDHTTPLSMGGEHAPWNMEVVPASWNCAKKNKHTNRWKPIFLS